MYILHGEIDAVRLLVDGDHVGLYRRKPLANVVFAALTIM
jgi:hypothetical protein